jgi:hypothetical protein
MGGRSWLVGGSRFLPLAAGGGGWGVLAPVKKETFELELKYQWIEN